MMADLRKGLKVFAIAAALAIPAFMPAQAGFAPTPAAMALKDTAALPLVEVQARRPVRRPARTVRRHNNGAAVAGALVGAAIIGGAIIANSEAQRREERRRAQYYYYGGPQYYHPQPQPRRRVYRDNYYYQDPGYYYQPQPRIRRVPQSLGHEPSYQPPGRVYRQPGYQSQRIYNAPRGGRTCIVNTPDKETPYSYVPC